MKRFVTALTLMTAALFFGSFSPMSAAEEVQLSKKQVKDLVSTAKTPEDHLKLAAYFNQEADRLEAEAKDHKELANAYRGRPATTGAKGTMTGRTAEHCEYFAKSANEAAKADRELAAEHEKMAKQAGK